MEKTIRNQYYRMGLVYLALVGLVIWQEHFVVGGIKANIYLNGIIIAAFLFGSLQAILGLTGLRNEVKAMRAIKEIYADISDERAGAKGASEARFARCEKPGIVYHSPELLGHVFTLTLEELLRTKHLRISMGTMETLVHAIQARIVHGRSLLGYLTGLSVFLGLIGTFIGLMEMVGSVGGIIGGLAKSDAGAEAMKQLIHDLEEPLRGMATGFSSSLFGLFGSLVLGLVSRFMSQAQQALKDEFEAWLAGISQIENEAQGGAQEARPGMTTGDAAQFGGAAVALMAGFRRSNETLSRATEVIARLAERQAEQTKVLEKVGRQSDGLAGQLTLVTKAMERVDLTRAEMQRHLEAMSSLRSFMDERATRDLGVLQQLMTMQHERTVKLIGEGGEAQARLQNSVDQVGQAMEAGLNDVRGGLVQCRGEQRAARDAVIQQSEALTRRIEAAVAEASRSIAAQVRQVEPALDDLGQRTVVLRDAIGAIAGSVEALRREAEVQARIRQVVESLSGQVDGQAERIEAALGQLSEQMAGQPHQIADAIGAGFAEAARAIAGFSQAASADNAEALQALASELKSLGRTIDEGMSSGFADVARSFESAFVSYSDLVRMVVSSQEGATPATAPGEASLRAEKSA